MSKEREKKMNLFNQNNQKKVSHEDGLWMEENNLFEFSEVSPMNDNEHDIAIEKSGHTFSNGQIHDRSINKRFVREFKKWVDRYERINRNIEWEFENKENVDDKIRLICNTLFTFHRYRNKFLLNTFIKCAEYVGENFLNKSDYRILITNLFSLMDLKDEDASRRFHTIFKELNNYKNSDLFLENKREYEVASKMEDNRDEYDQRRTEKEIGYKDIKSIQDNEYLILYRGFIVSNDDDIRITRSLPDNYVDEKNGWTKKDLIPIQNSGRGLSYTFCKKTAYSLTMLTNSKMRYYFQKWGKSKVVIGQYIVPTSKIFSYTNRRSEREVITSDAFLKHYEFVSRGIELTPVNTTDFKNLSEDDERERLPVCYYDKDRSAIHNLKSDLKIHRIYNNTEKVLLEFNQRMKHLKNYGKQLA